MSAVEEPVPRRALVVAPRADSVEVDAVDPVRELTLAWRSGGVEERQNCRFILCPRTRPNCDSDPARKKTSNHGDATTKARVPQSPIIGVCFVVQKELHDLDFSAGKRTCSGVQAPPSPRLCPRRGPTTAAPRRGDLLGMP